MAAEEPLRRIHPRLRMVANGDAGVNACRAELTTTVAQRDDTAGPEPSFSLGQAQEQVLHLEAADVPTGGRLPKRPKLAASRYARDALVNVFIDLGSVRSEAEARASTSGVLGEDDISELRSAGTLVAATVPVAGLSKLAASPGVSLIDRSEPLELDVPAGEVVRRAPARRRVSRGEPPAADRRALIGIIDVGGFDFAHPDFLDDDGQTRWVAIWDQGGTFRPPPNGFSYGALFTADHLAGAMAQSAGGFAPTDYEPQSQQADGSHGTHVASIAAGAQGVCPHADIAGVLVDLPRLDDERARRRFTFADTSRIAHAVDFLIDLATDRGQPLVINISLGTNGGPHDGTSGINRWLEARLAEPGRAVCIAAGNAGQEAATGPDDIGWTSGRIHTSGQIASRGLEVELEWVVVGNGLVDLSENELEIWYSPQDRITASVQPPGSSRWYEVKPQQYRENTRLGDGTTLSIYNELYHPSNGANHIAVYQSPNLDPANIRGVRAGVWRIRLRGEEIRDGRFHAWIERDDPAEIGRTPDQRYLRFPSFFTEGSNVDSHSISSLASGRSPIAVANLDGGAGAVNVSSSQGPTRDGRPKPDIAAPGTRVVAARGFARDDRGDWVSMTGTSMASPYVAGVVALMLEANPGLTSAQCAAILQRTAQPLPGVSFEWQNDAGFGQVQPREAVAEAKSFATNREVRR